MSDDAQTIDEKLNAYKKAYLDKKIDLDFLCNLLHTESYIRGRKVAAKLYACNAQGANFIDPYGENFDENPKE